MKPEIAKTTDILLPKGVDLYKWATVACDQFTSEPKYWEKLDEIVGGEPSTLRITFPEVYLSADNSERIENINRTMRKYVSDGVFENHPDTMILVERDTAETKGRAGIMLAVDLEAYDFTPFSDAYIKATEKTILERIPPRKEIRRNASVELPHIMLLIDDDKFDVVEPEFEKRGGYEVMYDTDLNMGGGHLKGYKIPEPEKVLDRLQKLLDEDVQTAKYGKATNFLFAVGDGNHSLATAKAHYEDLKKRLPAGEAENHPARYCLVEVQNIHQKSLSFEPIHRLLKGAGEDFLSEFEKEVKGTGSVEIFVNGEFRKFAAPENGAEAISQIQQFIDKYLKDKPQIELDFVHGIDHLKETAARYESVGVVMPKFPKEELFRFVLEKGILPRKAFSMGEAEEKRYYMEAKKIVKD